MSPHRSRFAGIFSVFCCAALGFCGVVLPAHAQPTPAPAKTASDEAAMDRSKRQADNVYRWIKYFADQPRKVELSKVRPKTDAPPVANRTDATPAAGQNQTAPVVEDVAATPSAPQTDTDAQQQQQPAPQTVAAAAPSPPESAVAAAPLRPVFVVEPAIPREMRGDVINAEVLLTFTVQRDGTVATPTVVTGSSRRLNRAAMNAIAQWRFEPISADRLTQIEFAFRQQ